MCMKHSHTGDEQRNDIETVLLKFRTYCEPRKNIVFECYQFWDRNQNASEPFFFFFLNIIYIIYNIILNFFFF